MSEKAKELKAFLGELENMLADADARYVDELKHGDRISVASTRGTYCGLKSAKDLAKYHIARAES